MVTLAVASLFGQPLANELKASFGLLGGTIGALDGNTLRLPDLGGRIAPLEANVISGPRGFVIRNCGPESLSVNGQGIPHSAESPIQAGDEVTIGPFLLRVTVAEVAAGVRSSPVTAGPLTAGPVTAGPLTAGPVTAGPVTAGPAPASPGADEFQRALLEGLGLPELEVPGGLTPELMETLGAVLREVTQGTIDLLRMRAEAKSRMHANMTMVGSREINPLKAAWDSGVALQHLLAPKRSDMLDPVQAMTDAYDDLRRHDRGLAAGIHAALAGLLQRFDPVQLEQQLPGGGGFDSMLPGGAKARRWDSLVELYDDLSIDAQQDFWALFNREFLKAYDGSPKT